MLVLLACIVLLPYALCVVVDVLSALADCIPCLDGSDKPQPWTPPPAPTAAEIANAARVAELDRLGCFR